MKDKIEENDKSMLTAASAAIAGLTWEDYCMIMSARHRRCVDEKTYSILKEARAVQDEIWKAR